MGKWKKFNLLDFAEIHNQSRIPLSKMERLEQPGEYPYYGASGIIDYVNDFLFDGDFVLISEDGENLKSRNTPIAFQGKGKFWVNNHAHVLKGKKSFHNRLLIYYFQNLDLNEYITGAVQPKLNKANLVSIPIYLPSNEQEQKAIVFVLSSLDDKIDLLHRQNKTLEAMAETLFREWFVEEGNFKLTLLDFIEINPKETISKGEIATYLEMRNVQTNDATPSFWYKREFKSGTKFRNGDTLLARITPCLQNGKKAFVQFLNENEVAWGSTEFLVFRTKKTYHPLCSYLLAMNDKFKSFAIKTMTGSSGRQRVQTDSLKQFKLNKLSVDKINELNEVFDDIAQKLKLNASQIRTLENQRDILLPKIMSGEIRIPTNEKT